MTYPSVVSSQTGLTFSASSPGTSHDLSLPSGSVGELLLAFIGYGGATNVVTWTGWTELGTDRIGTSPDGHVAVWYRVADGSEGATTTAVTSLAARVAYQIHRLSGYQGAPVAAPYQINTGFYTTLDPPNLSPGFGTVDTMWLAVAGWSSWTRDVSTYPSGYSGGASSGSVAVSSIRTAVAYTTSTALSEDPGVFTLTSDSWLTGTTVAVRGADDLVADFDAVPTFGDLPLTVGFFDMSSGGTGVVDTWAWDFGDGGTSTAQDPTHIYTVPGAYTVTFTVENDDGQIAAVTRSELIRAGSTYVAPSPAGALIEIRAAAVGAARWGVAHWGEDVWASAGWVDVTPQSVEAVVLWGSHSPEVGILTRVEAATWSIDTYDPDRLLDPGNSDSPYQADLRAGLPIRIRHRGTIVRQGVAETIAYFYAGKAGGIRVTDNVSILTRTDVPEDSILSDTLRARARDVIAAAGLRVTVESDPPTGDPALAPRLDGVVSAWWHIADAAEQALHVAYVDAIGTLRFRPWASPYDRGRGVDGSMLIDLGTIVATDGLYSVVAAQQTVADGDAIIERRLTPTPRYGAIAYTRSDPTLDAGDWADAVLADRSLQTVQWIPGEIYPLTAEDVEYFATIEAMERFGVEHDDVTPPVDITGIVVGGEFRVTSKKDSEARWRFTFELAQTADSPLYFDASDPPQFMLNDPGDGYLYGD